MARHPLRTVFCISLFLVLVLLGIFTNLNHQIIVSIAIIGVFLILFTYVFTIEKGHAALNVCVIVTSFIILPVFILLYLKVPDSLPVPWSGVLAVLAVIAFGILAVYAISKLNFVEIEFFDRRK